MTKEKEHNVRLGIFVFAGLILLIFGLYSIGRNKNMFGKSVHVHAIFYDVNGLVEGNNVRYAGINVGTVDKIEIVNDSAVRVDMIIDEKTQKYIHKNSVASVGTDGLMGNKLIIIGAGSPGNPSIQSGDELPTFRGVDTEAMLHTLNTTNDNIAVITTNLRLVSENLNESRGALYTLLNDTMVGKRIGYSIENVQLVSQNLITVSNQLELVMRNINSGDGILGVLMSDSTLAEDLRKSIQKIREGSENFSTITSDVSLMMKEVNSGNGTVTTLLKDTAMAGDLKTSIANLEKASATMNEELEALKHSFLLRPFYKHKK